MAWNSLRCTSFSLIAMCVGGCYQPQLRTFPDRPVAWHEHDDMGLAKEPSKKVEPSKVGYALNEFIVNEGDRKLSLETAEPARDINALDEVPCSTWFCPKNHLSLVAPEAVRAGATTGDPPKPPLTIVESKGGRQPGFIVTDARGKKYVLKFDPVGHVGLATGAEVVSSRLMHAAGYNVSGAFLIDLDEEDLRLTPESRIWYHDMEWKRFTPEERVQVLAQAAKLPDGKLRAVASPFLQGDVLGMFAFEGRRDDDPNDRIQHQERRSLRATKVFFAWINHADGDAMNTLDVVVDEGGRRFVRHYFIDFGASLGAWSTNPKAPHKGKEAVFDLGRTTTALATLGVWKRDWERDASGWNEVVTAWPSIGWIEGQGWDPNSFRMLVKVAAQQRMTPRDAYWGAKLVTSFTDVQIRAAVDAGDYDPAAAERLTRILAERRDLIGRRYLTAVTAVESPSVAVDASRVCFRDLALERGAATMAEVTYSWQLEDGKGHTLGRGAGRPVATSSCLDVGHGSRPVDGTAADTYRIVRVQSFVDGRGAKPALVHLRWRPESQRFVVVGLERAD